MNEQERLKFLKEMTEVSGISGHEKEVSRLFKKYVESYASEITYDNLGSIIAKQSGWTDDVKVMLAGHIDEIGFLVSKIENDGYLRITPIGGWWVHTMLAQRVQVITREGKKLLGVIGSIPPHGLSPEARSKVLDIKQVHVDLGVEDQEEVEKLGVRIGDPVVPVSEFTLMNNPKFMLAKAWDNRIGAAVTIEVMRNLADTNHPNTLYSCGTVQEEVGLRGAKTAAYAVKPDVAIAIDVTLANDVPGSSGDANLGKGVAISLKDSSVIGHRGLIAWLEELCKREKIPFVYDMLTAGGSDSGEIHKTNDGVINCTLSIPARYIHGHNAIIHMDDYLATIKLLTVMISELDSAKLKELRESNR